MLHLESYTSKGLFNLNVLYAARGLENSIRELEGYLLTLVDMGIITKTQQERTVESGSIKRLIKIFEEKSAEAK